MASHVRYIFRSAADGWFSGESALHKLGQYAGMEIKTPAQAIKAFKSLPNPRGFQFWVFREKRGLANGKSRYKQLCRLLGIGRQAPMPATPRRRQNARTNSPPRSAPAPARTTQTGIQYQYLAMPGGEYLAMPGGGGQILATQNSNWAMPVEEGGIGNAVMPI